MLPPPDNLLPFARCVPLPRWKRALDVLVASAVLPLLVPIALVMLLVTRTGAPGPVFFRQLRVGLNGSRFTMYKFRTMHAGASVASHQAHALDFIRNNRPMVKLDDAGDARLIPLGRLLRATGLDELPQIINVLLGDMSIVGPRPCIPYEFEAYEVWQKERFRTMPGITGLWQVSGKNKLSFEQMIHLDIRYAEELSLKNDLTILARTVPTLIGQVREAHRARRLARRARTTAPGFSPETGESGIVEANARRELVRFRFHS